MSDNPKQNRPDSLIREMVTGAVPLDWANFTVVMIVISISLTLVMTHWIGDMSPKDKIAFINTIALIIAGIGAGATAYASHKKNVLTQEANEINRQQNEESNRLSKSSQLDDRFSKAVEMLSHKSPSVISGGVYVLRDVALENPDKYLNTVLDIIEDLLRASIKNMELELQQNLSEDLRSIKEEVVVTHNEENDESLILSIWPKEDSKLPPLPHYAAAILMTTRLLREMHLNLTGNKRRGIDLSKLKFVGLSMEGLDLRDSNLSEAEFHLCNLEGANFAQARIEKTVFNTCNLHYASFENCSFVNAKFNGGHAEQASFEESTIIKTSFEDISLKFVSFNKSTLTRTEFKNKTNLVKSSFNNASITAILQITDSYLDFADFGTIEMDSEQETFNINFKGTTLEGTILPLFLHDFLGIDENALCMADPVKYQSLPPGIPSTQKDFIYKSQMMSKEDRSAEILF